MEDTEDRGEEISSDQTLEKSRRWEDQTLEETSVRVAFGPQQRGSRPVQRLDRAASGRACPAGGGGPPLSTPDRQTS